MKNGPNQYKICANGNSFDRISSHAHSGIFTTHCRSRYRVFVERNIGRRQLKKIHLNRSLCRFGEFSSSEDLRW
jgi:hypothetical protein